MGKLEQETESIGLLASEFLVSRDRLLEYYLWFNGSKVEGTVSTVLNARHVESTCTTFFWELVSVRALQGAYMNYIVHDSQSSIGL